MLNGQRIAIRRLFVALVCKIDNIQQILDAFSPLYETIFEDVAERTIEGVF